MFRGFLRPGQAFKPFEIWRRKGAVSEKGRPVTSKGRKTGWFYGALSDATPKEIEQAKQLGHPITHKIVQQYGEYRAKPTDIIKTPIGDGYFLVKTVKDPGELGHFTVYEVEERDDINEWDRDTVSCDC